MSGENLTNLFDVTPADELVEVPTTDAPAADVTPGAVATVVEPETPAVEVTPDETHTTPGVVAPIEENAAPKDEAAHSTDEVTQLRVLLREQNRRLRDLQSTVSKSNEELTKKGLIEEPSEEEAAAATQSQNTRAMLLETILETMRINPKFEDVDSIVTQSRFDDMVEGFAYATANKQGGSAEDYIDAVAAKIWAMPNPYRFMYEKIKEHHPDFKQAPAPSAPTPAASTPATKAEVTPKAHTAPPTISALPASSEGGGWTASRIDGLAEEDLGKVPRDIYEKYLSGDLK